MWAVLVLYVCMSTPTELSCKVVEVDLPKCTVSDIPVARTGWLKDHRDYKVIQQKCKWGRNA